MKTTLTSTKIAALRLAMAHGFVIVSPPSRRGMRDERPNLIAGNTFASLARAGLLTHDTNGRPEETFLAWVGGTECYLTPAGKAAIP